MKEFNRIRVVMAEKNMKVGDLAKAIGKHPSMVTGYRNNTSQPPLSTLYDIAKALHVPPCDLLADPPPGEKWW